MEKTIKIIVIFTVLLGMVLTLGKVSLAESSSTEEVAKIKINANSGYYGTINLVLGAHEEEKLSAEPLNNLFKPITESVSITWQSSNSTVATISSTGELKALKEGTTTITAKSGDVTATRDVQVYANTPFSDFSKAKYEATLNGTEEILKITGVTPVNDGKHTYYYAITSDKTKPEIQIGKRGEVNSDSDKVDKLIISKENYLYIHDFKKYAELNQDTYIWIIEDISLTSSYNNANGDFIYHKTKYLVEGQKIQKAELPKLNLILRSFFIGSGKQEDWGTSIYFTFPTNTENRKFTLKIGKVTDYSILTKIKNNDYTGITDLLSYAKKQNSIYSQELTTTSLACYRSEKNLFDGKKLLENKSYYYIYATFDDENGKFAPVEGITLAKAYFSESSSWNLYAYTSSDFSWDNISSAPSNIITSNTTINNTTVDNTIAKGILPHAGKTSLVVTAIMTIVGVSVILYKKYSIYKDI